MFSLSNFLRHWLDLPDVPADPAPSMSYGWVYEHLVGKSYRWEFKGEDEEGGGWIVTSYLVTAYGAVLFGEGGKLQRLLLSDMGKVVSFGRSANGEITISFEFGYKLTTN